MTISRITLTGQVLRNPEKRFTENNFAISSFTLGFGKENEEKNIKVFSLGNQAELTEQNIKKGQTVVVEGRLQTNSVKTESGTDKKYFEINAQNIEVLSAVSGSETNKNEPNTQFDLSEEIKDDIKTDDLIGEDEIPF